MYMNFFNFFLLLWKYHLKKNRGHYRATVSSITQKKHVSDMEFCFKNSSNIRNVTFIFQNFQKNSKGKQKIEKIHVDSEKSINSYEMKKG